MNQFIERKCLQKGVLDTKISQDIEGATKAGRHKPQPDKQDVVEGNDS
jgi:hypothetical protein